MSPGSQQMTRHYKWTGSTLYPLKHYPIAEFARQKTGQPLWALGWIHYNRSDQEGDPFVLPASSFNVQKWSSRETGRCSFAGIQCILISITKFKLTSVTKKNRASEKNIEDMDLKLHLFYTHNTFEDIISVRTIILNTWPY